METDERFKGFGDAYYLQDAKEKFERLLGRQLHRVEVSPDKELLRFFFGQGVSEEMYQTYGDCCSHTWIESLELPGEVAGREIVGVERMKFEEPRKEIDSFEVIQQYGYRFRLDNGEAITLEFRNASNGYYGGELTYVEPEYRAEVLSEE